MMADEIFAGQNLRLKLDTNTTLTASDIATALIKYKRLSDGCEGSWTATVDDGEETIYYDIPADILEESDYIFWAHITYNSGTVRIGNPIKKRINREGAYPSR